MTEPAPTLHHLCLLDADLASTLRKARGALGWSRPALSAVSGVAVRTIARIEDGDGEGQVGTLRKLIRTLENHGVELWRDDAGRVLVTTKAERTLSRAERKAELQLVRAS